MSEENQIVLMDIYHSILVNLTLVNLICENKRCEKNPKMEAMKAHYEELKEECEAALIKYNVDPNEKSINEEELMLLRDKISAGAKEKNEDIAELFYVFSKVDRDNIKERLKVYHQQQRDIINIIDKSLVYNDINLRE